MFSLFSIELHSHIEVHYYRPMQTLDKWFLCVLVPCKRKENPWIFISAPQALRCLQSVCMLPWCTGLWRVPGHEACAACDISTGCRAPKWGHLWQKVHLWQTGHLGLYGWDDEDEVLCITQLCAVVLSLNIGSVCFCHRPTWAIGLILKGSSTAVTNWLRTHDIK